MTAEAAEPAPAADVLLADMLETLNLTMTYNPLIDQVLFARNEEFVSVTAGSNWAIHNGIHRIVFPADGLLLQQGKISNAAYASLSTVFPPPAAVLPDLRTISTIFIDPGHGGKDPGTIGRQVVDGKTVLLNEKDIVLTVSLRLRDLLRRQYPDKRIVLSRETDTYLPLEERTQLANKYADSRHHNTLFVSLHANASPNSRAKGYEVWYLPPEYRRQLLKEGDVTVADNSVLPIINHIIEEEFSMSSILLGQSILRGMEHASAGLSVNRGLKEEEWHVVRSAHMPSVLIELGFVTNPEEFTLLGSDAYLQKLGEGIYNGILGFIGDFERQSAR